MQTIPTRWLALTIALLFMVGCGGPDGGQPAATGSTTSRPTSGSGGLSITISRPDLQTAFAETDRNIYFAGDAGAGTFLNTGSEPLFLPGCAPFVLEQRLDGAWEFVGPPFVCVWEGVAYLVSTNRIHTTAFTAPNESGLYRLRYDYSSGCELGLPLSQANCAAEHVVYSNIFEVVRELCDPAVPDCRFVPGAPNVLCPDGVHFSGPSDECTRDPETWECGYEFLSCS